MADILFERIALIGIGLIGSSIARDIKELGLARDVVVSTRSEETLKRAEENEKNRGHRGRHSNLPFDETFSPRGGEDVPRLGKSKARPSPSPVGEKRSVRQVSWLPDLSPSGSFPDARPFRSHASSGFSPGASPVTVAGAARDLHPLPSTERNQRTSGEDTPMVSSIQAGSTGAGSTGAGSAGARNSFLLRLPATGFRLPSR